MNYKFLLIEVFAVIAAYLITAMPAAYATEVSVWYDGAQTQYNPEINQDAFVTILKTINSDRVTINITNSTPEYDMDSALIFKCKDKDPAECIDTETPDTDTDMTYDWSDISSSNVANLFLLVKLINEDIGFNPWVGFWHTIEKDGMDYTQTNYFLDSMEAHVEDYGNRWNTEQWIIGKMNVPFNWLGYPYTVFSDTNKIYGIGTNNFLTFDNETVLDDSITSIDQKYYFAFPETSDGRIMNPITFYANSADTECGNGDCESGESSTTCCYDCFCSSGRYCDTGGSKDGVCKLESLIDLDVTQVSQTMFSNCNEEHDLFVTVKIINPPTNANIQSISYKLDADSYQTVSCEDLGNYYYRCPVTIPSFPFGSLPECSGTQSYTITGNSIKLVISYYDGPSQSTNQELYASFDDLIVGSYVCGNNQCETALGENAENCCYDCECPTNQYCDTESPVIGDMCRNELTNNDFAIISTEPENFETYKTSDKITITSKINDIPSTLTVSDTACSLGCVFSDETGQHVCDAWCTPSCTGSVNGGAYDSVCELAFGITTPQYQSQNSYLLTPTLTQSVHYANSEQSISDELSATSSGISIGSSFCGDGICDTTGLVESYDSCCYDCPCESGYYCDTQNTQGPSASDECKAEDDISLEINNINPSSLSFSDYSQENIIEFNAQIINPPSGMDYGYECTFGDGTEMPCNIDCDPDPDTSTEDLYNMSCSITIDPINNYESLSFYDSATDLITITPNNIDFSLTYNNGQNTDNKELSAVLGDINLVVLAHCGSGAGYRTYDSRCDPNDREAACETNLGENSETCCCDCGCPTGNEYCYYEPDDIGDYGTCSAADDIELVLIGISPDTATCCIDNYQVGCVFATMGGECASMENVQWNFNSAGDITMTNRITLRTKVTNPPPDLKLHFGNYYLEIDGEKQDGLTGVVCSEYPSAGHGHYKCEFVLDRIEDATIGSETKNVELFFTVEYTLGDQTVTKNLSTSTSFTIERAKTDILIEAEEEIDDINDKIDRMNIIKAVIYSVLAVGLAIVIGFCICCALPGTQPFCCSVCGWGMVLYACISSVLIGVLLALISHVNDLKVQKEALNAQIGKSSDAAESGMSTEQLAVMGSGVVFTIICFVGLFMGGGGGGSAATATSGSTGSGGAGTGSMAITSADEMAWDSWYITGPPAPP